MDVNSLRTRAEQRVKLAVVVILGIGLAGCSILSGQGVPDAPSAAQPPIAPVPATNNPAVGDEMKTTIPEVRTVAPDTTDATLQLLTPSPSPAATTTPAGPSPTPFPLTLPASITPTPTFTLPAGEIQIFAPGPLSKVISPMRVWAILQPGSGGRVLLELLGEDGRLLVRQLLRFANIPGRFVNLATEIEFEVAGVAEAARLQLSTEDNMGHMTKLASVPLILLSAGESDLNPSGDLLAPIIIQEPRPSMFVQGGELLVAGLARLASAQPLAIELIDPDGKIVGSRLVEVPGAPSGEHLPFVTMVPYKLDKTTQVLLVVRERDERIPGLIHLTSRVVFLGP